MIEDYDVKSVGQFMWTLMSKILDNPFSVVVGNRSLSKGLLPFGTFYAVKSTKMDENQKVKKNLNQKSSSGFRSTKILALGLMRRICKTRSVFYMNF